MPPIDLARIWAIVAADPAFAIAVTAATLALGDFLTGLGRAFRAGTVSADLLGTWVGGQLLGRVMPIAGIALLGEANPGLEAIAALALGTYTVETVASMRRNLEIPDEAQPGSRTLTPLSDDTATSGSFHTAASPEVWLGFDGSKSRDSTARRPSP